MNRCQQSNLWMAHLTSKSPGGRSGQSHLMVPQAGKQHPAAAAAAAALAPQRCHSLSSESCSFHQSLHMCRLLSGGCRAWIRPHFTHQTCLGTKLLEQIQTQSPPRV